MQSLQVENFISILIFSINFVTRRLTNVDKYTAILKCNVPKIKNIYYLLIIAAKV